MSAISSHVLDTSLGKPAASVSVSLALLEDGAFVELAAASLTKTAASSSCSARARFTAGVYRLRFETGAHYRANRARFILRASRTSISRHRPEPALPCCRLLLSPFGYSTYRGS